MYIQQSRNAIHKQDAFRCHQQFSLHFVRPLTGTLTLVVVSHEMKITVDVQIY